MPYETTASLPVNVRSKYSEKALKAFLAAFNTIFAQTKDESRAFAGAHSAARKIDGLGVAESEIMEMANFREAEWSSAFINDLPDSSFAYIESGGEKDEGGKTVPRSLRHFPYKDSAGKVDLPHLRNALARAPQSPHGAKAMPKLKAAAKAAKIGEFTEASFWIDGEFKEVTTEDGVSKARVTVIKPGLSANNFYYSERVLSGLVPLLEGAKAYADHETKSELKDRGSRSIKDIVGWYDGVSQGADGEVNATLNFAPGNENLVEALKINPSLVGLSINAKGRASRGDVNGKKAHIAEAFDKLYSTDLVTEAAAGGEVTRMVASVMEIEEANDDIKEGEPMEDNEKLQASWLLAEMSYKHDVGQVERHREVNQGEGH